MPPSRSGTLSWQQRPTSRGSVGAKVRPLSQIAAENKTSRSPHPSAVPSSTDEQEVSREQIAESLGVKDPAWFRQTQDRGFRSAAYRRNQDGFMSDATSLAASMRLPGLSRESTLEPERQISPAPESIRSVSPSRTDSVRGGSISQFNLRSNTTVSSSIGTRSSIPNFVPPSSNTSAHSKDPPTVRGMAMSPAQERILPERMDRPVSPTKGLGGFVQSAMLKRSDSVNKRWSAQPGTGLSRGNSIASNRSGYEGPKYGIPYLNAPNDQISTPASREASPITTSGPITGQSAATLAQPTKDSDKFDFHASIQPTRKIPTFEDGPISIVPSQELLSSELSKSDEATKSRSLPQGSPPSSPGKRWSPNKSSWLENAINKPDSSKPKMPPPQQPSWMTNISHARQHRGSADLTKGNTFKEVSTSGLLRSPPMGAAKLPPSIGTVRAGLDAGADNIEKTEEHRPVMTKIDHLRGQISDNEPESLSVTETSPSAAAEMKAIKSPSPKPIRSTSSAKVSNEQTVMQQQPKPKPETPPKKDFRSNLKPRQTSSGKKTGEDPEFKNVFGKLKRTQTQNYVAPDELKDNILRGKAGLATTGGPKKTERRDEFKESLLKQKEAMKAGSPSVGRKPSAGGSPKDRVPPKPEALPKKSGLTRTQSSTTDVDEDVAQAQQQPEALAKFSRLREKSQPTPSKSPPQASSGLETLLPVNNKAHSEFNSSLAGILSRGPPPSNDSQSPSKITSNEHYMDEEAPLTTTLQVAGDGPQLTHMTKSRARGPKRRLPTATGIEEPCERRNEPRLNPDPLDLNVAERKAASGALNPIMKAPQSRPLATISNNHRKPSQPQAPRKPSINVNAPEVAASSIPPSNKPVPSKPTSPKPRSLPPINPKSVSPELDRSRKASTSTPPVSNASSGMTQERNRKEEPLESSSSPTVETQAMPQESRSLPSVKGAAASWGQTKLSERSLPFRARSPIKLPTRKDEEAAMKDAGLLSKAETPIGLGIGAVPQAPPSPVSANHNLPTPPLTSPKSPPLPAKKSSSITNRIISNPSISEAPSHGNQASAPQISEATRLLAEIFDESPTTDLKVNIDTPAVLASRISASESDKIRTLRKQLWEVSSGGKLIPVSPDQSHILFEDSLYICHHVFGSLTGARTTEVYLWCGDGVATSAVEDAHIFARKEAKDHGGKLIVLQQGKETSNFFQALGGIVITRYGQSDRASSRYMLCGRRHVGQIAFDEVDFSLRSLCKGFSYLISSGTASKIHLWKGIGSGIDELGCARLIGMDLGSGGEIEEIEDGKEPDKFWKLFPDAGQQSSLSSSFRHWHLRSSCEQYATRLYKVDIEAPRPKSSSGFKWGRRGSAPASASTPTDETSKWNAVMKEIAPFAQSDIFYDGVFVLDTFFEVFVILPSFPSTSLLLPAFRTACLFAQEYAILAASAANENRPFVPQGSVLLLGIGRDPVPEGVESAFRKWDRGKVRGCRVLGLVECLRGLGGG
ncbi:MAG: hypothetical protein L6R41_000878 [Letrouitia leprolyta]|nr:MAG: hypothetical protein L6R41_000878 [Letrouitia leprolyta]